MERRIQIAVRDKIATKTCDTVYVCGNSDYVIDFQFDAEWDEHRVKTARFITEDLTVHDVVFEGTVCNVPVISNSHKIRVGVFAGNLRTTTPAYVPARKSILCGGGMPADPPDDVYAQIMGKVNEAVQTADDVQKRADAGEFNGVDGTDATVTAENISKALGYTPVKPKKFELVEAITLTENTRDIIRSKTPDGEPYKYEQIMLYVRVAAGTTDYDGVLQVYADSKASLVIIENMVKVDAQTHTKIHVDASEGIFNIMASVPAPNIAAYAAYNTAPNVVKINNGQTITQIRLLAMSGTFPKDSRIEIYGVRA